MTKTKKLFETMDINMSFKNDLTVKDGNNNSIEYSVIAHDSLDVDVHVYQFDKNSTYTIDYKNFNCAVKFIVTSDCTILDLSSKNVSAYNEVQLEVKNGANVNYLVFDGYDKFYGNRKINVYDKSYLNFKVIGLNKILSENNIEINLCEDSAKCDFKLVTVATDSCDNVYDVVMNNLAPNTSGDIWQKAVCKNGGNNAFLATGHISKGSDDASNYQESRVLLLDGASTGDASPLLLIDHYNVVAGHAASVSRVNQEELYYLQTRGIDQKSAEYLMTLAFIKPLFDEIEDEDVRTNLLNQVSEII